MAIKENFYPDLLDSGEILDLEQANLEWDLADSRSDCIGPFEVVKTSFIIFCSLSKLLKFGNITGINQAIKDQLTQLKKDLISLFKTQTENPNVLRSIRILDEIDELTTRLESQPENPTADTIEITTAALDVVGLITPHTVIANIVTTGKMLSELNKPLANTNTLGISQKVCKIAGHPGKVASEFTPLPAIGRIFSNAVLMAGSVLGIVDRQNAA